MADKPKVTFLSGGERVHLQHGPIDLIIGAEGERFRGFFAAQQRFDTVLAELVVELKSLRLPLKAQTPEPKGEIALRMHRAALPFCDTFLTRMVCVAGAVADTVLHAMIEVPLSRAYVNNGGDIALYLSESTHFDMAIARDDGAVLGHLHVSPDDGVGGVATSGRHGRSFSMGIADAVTVLAKDAATADTAATLIANAVDLPDHPMIRRVPANVVDPDSDLGDRLIVTDCAELNDTEIQLALKRGAELAEAFAKAGKINDAALFLAGQYRILGHGCFEAEPPDRIRNHA